MPQERTYAIMTKLGEYEQRVLAALEEAWQENAYSILNTIIEPLGKPEEVQLLQEALQSLVRMDYVAMGMETFHPRQDEWLSQSNSLALILTLEQWFEFDTSDLSWTLRGKAWKDSAYPAVRLTETGKDMAFKILDQRGYQWWESAP